MIVRKTYRADIDRLRPKIFLLAFIAVVGVFLLVLQWQSVNFTSRLLEDISDDVEVDMDFLASLKPEEDVIAAKVHEQPSSTDQINKVDELTDQAELEELKEQVKFTTSESDNADQLKESEADPIAPANASVAGEDVPLRVVEQLPEFPGGMSIFMTWLTNELHYPPSCRKANQQGTVSVKFVVEKDGSITNVEIAQPSYAPLNTEALRVIKAMPKWKPGQEKGKPARTVVAIPIVFAL
ncbi:energy transducer TonB [Prevotella sp. PINT]|uniref:energy transducer TonB n=1 Tax=Palleniella intestinalis TaxID=2736291 RepID=UPI0015530781|nr:energy transducer TonB [Palleniella intestinalis]NPD80405.1 energy transducer TonB [Palleniella intestinalis]